MRTVTSAALGACVLLGAFAVIGDPGAAEEAHQAADKLLESARALFEPIPDQVTEVRGEKVTEAKTELGKLLFFDPRLSRNHAVSCNTCHNLKTGGADNLPTSTGHKLEDGPRNSATVLNALFNVAEFVGRAKDLHEQAKRPVEAAVEMLNASDRLQQTLRSIPTYVEMFKKAFPGKSEPVSFDSVVKAIEAFEATLITPDSRFDQFLKGKLDALSAQEQKGLALFMDKGCASCHAGKNVGGHVYFPFGVFARDHGRVAVVNSEADDYVFRATSLRNVALTAPYFHSGQVRSLKEAVALMGSVQLSQQLDEKEVAAIASFLGTLTGEQPKVTDPILPPSTSRTPLPE